MLQSSPYPLYFYIPDFHIIDYDAVNINHFWDFIVKIDSLNDPLSIKSTALSNFVWILQTYLYLKEKGFPCTLVHSIPDEGVIIGHTWDIRHDMMPTTKRIFVSVQSEKKHVYPYAHFHIVQNKTDPLFSSPYKDYFNPIYIRHWPQPNLIPRDPKRGDLFKNFAYKGRWGKLDFAIKEAIESLGFHFKIALTPKSWPDYSDIDCVVAIREESKECSRKPPTKLFNAWLAHVPAILGKEPAYQNERKNALDYLEAENLLELKKRIIELRDNPNLRKKMVENGHERAKEITRDAIVKDWIDFLTKRALPTYGAWLESPSISKEFFRRRKFAARLVGP